MRMALLGGLLCPMPMAEDRALKRALEFLSARRGG
jgi:hypothetical protein